MEGIRDFVNSVRAHVQARLTNPLFGAYLFGWTVINFRLLVVIFGEGTWREKIEYIDHSLFVSNWDWAWFGVAYPLLVAIVLVLLSPFVARWVTVFLRAREKETMAQLLRIAEETPMPREEADRLRMRIADERQARKEQEDRYNAEIADLNGIIREMKKGLASKSNSALPLAGSGPEPDAGATQNKSAEHFQFQKSDFVGVGDNYVSALTERGLTQNELSALYCMREGADGYYGQEIKDFLGLEEDYEAQVILDRLRGFRLTESGDRDTDASRISSLGRQALSAAMKQGFKPVPI